MMSWENVLGWEIKGVCVESGIIIDWVCGYWLFSNVVILCGIKLFR